MAPTKKVAASWSAWSSGFRVQLLAFGNLGAEVKGSFGSLSRRIQQNREEEAGEKGRRLPGISAPTEGPFRVVPCSF